MHQAPHTADRPRVPLLLPDEENLSGNDARAQIFRVRGAASDAREQRVFRKTDLEHFARKLQISATLGWGPGPQMKRCPQSPVRKRGEK